MNRLEPNLLLALTTALALAFLVSAAVVAAPPGVAIKYVAVASLCPAAFVFLNGLWSRRTGADRPPLIRPDAPRATIVWAALFPLSIMLAAVVPLMWPGRDIGLLVIIAAIWFGVTVESAIKARRAA